MAAVPTRFALQRPSVLLFGDSLTEWGFKPGGWASALANHYNRKADVVSRGLSGYNTRWALRVVDDVVLGSSVPVKPVLATLWFGANDAALPVGPAARQHVPVTEYETNLEHLVAALQALDGCKVVLITPPPVVDGMRQQDALQRYGSDLGARLPLDRSLDGVTPYAAACVRVASKLQVPVVDVFASIQQQESWQDFFDDGLHLSPSGNQHVFERIAGMIEAVYPDISPSALPVQFPLWDHVDWRDPNNTFGAALDALRHQGPKASAPLPVPVEPPPLRLRDSN